MWLASAVVIALLAPAHSGDAKTPTKKAADKGAATDKVESRPKVREVTKDGEI